MRQQRLNPAHQAHVIVLLSFLQTTLQRLDGRARQLYSDTHGCSLLGWVWQSCSEEVHPFSFLRQSQLSKSFS
jgi:hypothetical protein